ncbi:phage antirepressor protein [Pseudomonas syringae]|uniref:phage antirepressor KilAC domain-containing protein n=1 Tax=Pseudomonas syringae TaxID=317 RepID=UPI001F2B56B6|nr:phage antirepressor KilAC domain-containing protein [Pseudomonas syringae]MCF5551912.1 phage antirepressor protein [Pseudomonas syringae]
MQIESQSNTPVPRHEIAPSQIVARTMSSREIADLVGSRHDKVKQSIERLAARNDSTGKPVIALPPMGEYLDSLGRRASEYLVCKRDSFVVVAQLSPEFTAALVDRWQELEQSQGRVIARLPDFSNPAAAARAWAEQFEMQQAANQALAIAAPKAEFVDKYVESTGLKGFRQTAKLLGANEARLREFLLDRRIMYRMGGEWQAYQNHVDAGRFQVKTGTSDAGHAFNQAKFTPKGVNWVAGLWAQYQLEARQ